MIGFLLAVGLGSAIAWAVVAKLDDRHRSMPSPSTLLSGLAVVAFVAGPMIAATTDSDPALSAGLAFVSMVVLARSVLPWVVQAMRDNRDIDRRSTRGP